MKKIISLVLCICFAFSLTACKKEEKNDTINFNNVTSSQSTNSDTNTDTASESNTTDSEANVSTDEEAKTVLSQLIENNEDLLEVVEDAKKMLNIESFSFKAVADVDNVSKGTQKNHVALGTVNFDSESGTIKIKINYEEKEIFVYSEKDGDTFIATRSEENNQWVVEEGEDSEDSEETEKSIINKDNYIKTIVNIIKSLRNLSSSGDLDFAAVVNKVLGYLGLNASIEEEKLNDFATEIAKSFTSKKNLKNLLGYSKSKYTDGMTYSISPDLVACTEELMVLMEPLFEDEEKYNTVCSILAFQQFALMNTEVSASVKLDKDKHLKTASFELTSPDSLIISANLEVTDINNELLEIDPELQKIFDSKE